jgi:hypothetical protein
MDVLPRCNQMLFLLAPGELVHENTELWEIEFHKPRNNGLCHFLGIL